MLIDDDKDPLVHGARAVIEKCRRRGCATCAAVKGDAYPPLFAFALAERRDVLGAANDAVEDMRMRDQMEAAARGAEVTHG